MSAMKTVSFESTVSVEGCILFENGVKVFYPLPTKAPPTPSLYSSLPFALPKKSVKFARFTQEFPPLPEFKETEVESATEVESIASIETVTKLESVVSIETVAELKSVVSIETVIPEVSVPTVKSTEGILGGQGTFVQPIPPVRHDSLGRFTKPSFLALAQ
jgi:hypothetical protein